MEDSLTAEEKQTLLELARSSMENAVRGGTQPPLDLRLFGRHLREPGASFVTLTVRGELRGCIGALEPSQPLASDVCEHAIAAALDDPRFDPVRPGELAAIDIEVSRLTLPRDLHYVDSQDLLRQLRPGVDGVILRDGRRRATFLPQVWEKLPDKSEFLDQLCAKMGAMPGEWRTRPMQVQVYQVEEFHE